MCAPFALLVRNLLDPFAGIWLKAEMEILQSDSPRIDRVSLSLLSSYELTGALAKLLPLRATPTPRVVPKALCTTLFLWDDFSQGLPPQILLKHSQHV